MGLLKHFFYPGFTVDTGGLLRESDLQARHAAFNRAAWLAQRGICWQGQRLISLFCYEPAALPALLRALAADALPTVLLVTAGRASAAVRRVINHEIRLQPLQRMGEQLLISYLPALTQTDYDHLLWACDLNFVRGEDSLVRALWAGRPFIWQIYPQDDAAHHTKLHAFLDWLQAPASLRQAYEVWNGLPNRARQASAPPLVCDALLQSWQATFSHAQQTLRQQRDLTSQLLDFVAKTH